MVTRSITIWYDDLLLLLLLTLIGEQIPYTPSATTNIVHVSSINSTKIIDQPCMIKLVIVIKDQMKIFLLSLVTWCSTSK